MTKKIKKKDRQKYLDTLAHTEAEGNLKAKK